MFLIVKETSGQFYFSLAESKRINGKPTQVIKDDLGSYAEAKAKLIDKKLLARLEVLADRHCIDRIASHKTKLAKEIRQNPMRLPNTKFDVILADPPWKYELREKDRTHRNRTDYPMMDLDDICKLDVASIANENSYLFCWTTKDYLLKMEKVLAAWGFKYKQCITWVKVTSDRSKIQLGTGHWLRNACEYLIIGARGKARAFSSDIRIARSTPNVFEEPRRRGRHSEKPAIFHALIEDLTPNMSRCELFARKSRDGWVTWGAESKLFD